MWRDDHIGDAVGAIFLGIADDAAKRLAEYFGQKVRVVSVEIVHNQARVEIACVRMTAESDQLVTTAKEVRAKGLLRNAQSLFEEALALDPLNPDALLGLALLLAEGKQFPRSLALLKLAREAGGDRAEVLHGLAGVSLKLEQPGAATGYLRRAVELSPDDLTIRRSLAALEPKAPGDPQPAVASDVSPRNNRGAY